MPSHFAEISNVELFSQLLFFLSQFQNSKEYCIGSSSKTWT